MAEPSTVARPYAEAAFRLADEAGALARWSEMLGALAAVAQDPRVRQAAADPRLSDAQRAGLFIAVLGNRLTGEAENFVRVLAHNEAAVRLYEQAGFVVEGVLRGEFFLDGQYVDDTLMALDLTT